MLFSPGKHSLPRPVVFLPAGHAHAFPLFFPFVFSAREPRILGILLGISASLLLLLLFFVLPALPAAFAGFAGKLSLWQQNTDKKKDGEM